MTNLSKIYNSGSLYEQLISQVIAVESQPRLKLVAEKTEQGVYKGVLNDFSSKASALDSLLDKLADPLRSPFSAKAATVADGAGFSATASDSAAAGQHEVQVTQLARADARLSKRYADGGTGLAEMFVDPGNPGGPFGIPPPTPDTIGTRSFTVHLAQPDGDPVDLAVSYSPPEGATDADVLAGLAAAVNDAVAAAQADGLLAEGTGASASVVHETSGTSRLSLRSEATGFGNRLTFSDPDGILAALEVDRTEVRSGTGGGAVVAVGTSVEDSALSAAFTLDGLSIYRDSNTVGDALDGVTLTLSSVSGAPAALTVGADAAGMRSEVEAFVKAYNGLVSFLNTKSKVDGDTGARGRFAGDSAISGLRAGLRNDLSRGIGGTGDLRRLADLGIETARDGTLSIADGDALDQALRDTPDAVGALFSSEGGLSERLSARVEGLLGPQGTIEQRRRGSDDRIRRIDGQISRWETRLAAREELLRAQFAQLQVITTQAEGQFASLQSLFYF
ncbi:flagellar filament capping protein FliD [Rubrivirga sp.]|uniref:flagellar filament capping protein FliD n=1 Tax=Rubrivirga sp. TaxID=1885344 RepID=UPI003B52277E